MLNREVTVYDFRLQLGSEILAEKLSSLYAEGYSVLSSTNTGRDSLLLILDRPGRETRETLPDAPAPFEYNYAYPEDNAFNEKFAREARAAHDARMAKQDSRPLTDWERELLNGVPDADTE